MWLGGYDPAAASASPLYTEMNTALPYYVVNLAGLTLGGDSVGFSPTFAIADTGTTLFYVPTAVANGVKARASAATDLFGTFSSMQGVDCAMAQPGVTAAQIDAALPPLSLTFDDPTGTPFTVESPATRSYLFDGGGGLWCVGLVDNAQLGANIVLMGDMGLRGFVTIFDLDHQQVGFAPDRGCGARKRKAVISPLRERGNLPAIAR
jgi:hypothetical protein